MRSSFGGRDTSSARAWNASASPTRRGAASSTSRPSTRSWARPVARTFRTQSEPEPYTRTNKDAILDGVVDAVFTAIELPNADRDDWRDAIRARANSARAVLSRHSWALGLMDSRRNPGPATLRHHNAVLGVLREAGFTLAMAVHAVSLIDSYVGGFVLQEANLPLTKQGDVEQVAGDILEHLPADELPYLTEVIVDHALKPGYDHTSEFSYGLDLILEALDARR